MRGLNEYYPLIFTPFPLGSTAKIGERRLLRKGERQSGYSCVTFANDSQFTDNVLLHMSATLRRVGITVPTNGFTVYDARQFWVGREQIEQALAEEFVSDERAQIAELLEKRHYDAAQADRREQQRMYQFLMRRGFKSSDILAVMREEHFFDEF